MAWQTAINQSTQETVVFNPEFEMGREFSRSEIEKLNIKVGAQLTRSSNDVEITQSRLTALNDEITAIAAMKSSIEEAISVLDEA